MSKIAGITIERTTRGLPRYARIDLRKFPEFISILEDKGIVVEQEVKFSAKLKRSFRQAENGEYEKGDINLFGE